MENLNRECQSYLLPGVASSTCFRKLYVVDTGEAAASDKFVALEWLETTLAQDTNLARTLLFLWRKF